MITLQGKGVSSGIAFGTIMSLRRTSALVEKRLITDAAGEVERFNAARLKACDQLIQDPQIALSMITEICGICVICGPLLILRGLAQQYRLYYNGIKADRNAF
jgi:phosphoenolpyruvate-protein kinase (PTS system EI component)